MSATGMNSFGFVVGMVLLAASFDNVAAQPAAGPAPGPAESRSSVAAAAQALEQQLVEALAVDGVVLSRLGVVADVERFEGRALVSLVETATGRTVASTKIESLPAPADAAVLALKPVVVGLVEQLGARNLAPASPPSAEPTEAQRIEALEKTQREQQAREQQERAERDRLASAERQYRELAIHFDRMLVVTNTFGGFNASNPGGGFGSWWRQQWIAHQGETEVPLEGADFYEVIGRQDLVRAYQRRRTTGISLLLGAGVVGTASLLVAFHRVDVTPDFSRCMTGDFSNDFGCRIDAKSRADEQSADQSSTYLLAGSAGLLVATIVGLVGWRNLLVPHPISETEARQLGGEYNRRLRKRLGIPQTAKREPQRRSTAWAPFASASGGGVAVLGTF
jgi:hypothetical protein